jgi:hypothetical protein
MCRPSCQSHEDEIFFQKDCLIRLHGEECLCRQTAVLSRSHLDNKLVHEKNLFRKSCDTCIFKESKHKINIKSWIESGSRWNTPACKFLCNDYTCFLIGITGLGVLYDIDKSNILTTTVPSPTIVVLPNIKVKNISKPYH